MAENCLTDLRASVVYEFLCVGCNHSGFPKETPELKFRLGFFFRSVANRSQVQITHAQPLTLTYGRRFD